MKLILASHPNGVNSQPALDTLAQVGTNHSETPKNEGFDLVPCTSSEAHNALLKRARAKYLTNGIIYRLADLESPLNKSYWNTYHCVNHLKVSAGKVTGKYCKNRWCMVCNRIRTAKLINTYSGTLSTWSDKHFLTLTIPNVKASELPLAIKVMNHGLKQILDVCKKRNQRKRNSAPAVIGIRKLECTYNPIRNDFHPHYHIITKDKLSAYEIKEQWLKKFPYCSDLAQDIRPADNSSCIELFKYFTKIISKSVSCDGKSKIQILPVVLDTIFRSIKGVRTFQSFGFKVEKAEDPALVEAEDLQGQLDEMMYEWIQELADWICKESGEMLTDYKPSQKMTELVRGIE